MNRFIGGGIDSRVKKQLDVRAEIASKIKGNDRKKFIEFHLSSTAFVNVISSVNIVETTNTSIKGSNLAKNFILSGGQTRWGENNREFTDSRRTRYTNTGLGIRPVPGITSFKISYKGTYGTVKDATVEFKVYSLEDLEVVETLYLRPGFSVIVEWGHTTFLKNNKNIEYITPTILDDNTIFTDIEFLKLESLLRSKKEKADFNYDSFVGLIKNFSYKINKEGGYDCSIDVISKGEILDSIYTSSPTTSIIDSEDSKKYSKTVNLLTQFTRTIKRRTVFFQNKRTEGEEKRLSLQSAALPGNTPESLSDASNNIRPPYRSKIKNLSESLNIQTGKNYLGFAKSIEFKGKFWQNDESLIYIPLSVVFGLFNYFLRFEANFDDSPYFNITKHERYFKYLTFPGHVSVDPLVAILPKTGEGRLSTLYPLISGQIATSNLVSGDYEDIRNIHVTNMYLDDLFQKYTKDSFNETSTFLKMVKEMLDEISRALGGINQLDIEYDDELDTFFLIDRNLVGIENINKSNSLQEIVTIPLVGLASTVTDLSIETKISKDLISFLSIGAQGTFSSVNAFTLQYRQWRQGLEDRFKKGNKNSTSTEEEDTFFPPINSFYAKLKNFYDGMRSENDAKIFTDELQEIQGIGQDIYKTLVQVSKVKKKEPAPGIIPLELSFTIPGISGLKIGQTFKVERGIISSLYNNYAFIITGLDASVQNSRWTTTIKGLCYLATPQYSTTSIEIADDIITRLLNGSFEKTQQQQYKLSLGEAFIVSSVTGGLGPFIGSLVGAALLRRRRNTLGANQD